MFSPFTADKFRDVGLLPFHFQFAQKYFEQDSPKIWLMTAPVGTGLTKMASHIISRELTTHESARALVLAPPALLDQWQNEISKADRDLEIHVVDRNRFLELEASSTQADTLWPSKAVVVMSVDLAKRPDIRSALVSTVWNLVVVNECHLLTGQRYQLFRTLVEEHSLERGLLLTNIAGTSFDGVNSYEITEDEVTNWMGNPVFSFSEREICSIEYTRTGDEVKFLQRLVEFGHELTNAFVSGYPQKEILLRSAASSIYTVETVLRRLLDGWRPLRNKLAHGIAPSSSDLSRIQARLKSVVDEASVEMDSSDPPVKDISSFLRSFSVMESLMESIDDISVDSKLEALMGHLTNDSVMRDKHRCIWTSFRTTGDYLYTSLNTLGVPVLYVNGAIDAFSRSRIFKEFQKSAGIVIVTDVALEGINLHFVSECINFDLPAEYSRFEQRWGRFLRIGRETPFQMFVLQDQGMSLDWEERILAALLSR